jgi:hypothetical protein
MPSRTEHIRITAARVTVMNTFWNRDSRFGRKKRGTSRLSPSFSHIRRGDPVPAGTVRRGGNMATTKGLVITVAVALVLISIFVLLILNMTNAARLSSNPLFSLVLVFGLVPLYPLYRLAKRLPHFSLSIFAVAACLLVTLAAGVFYFVFHFDDPWIEYLFDLCPILWALTGFSLVWQATRRHG